jgi:hypothetical protein
LCDLSTLAPDIVLDKTRAKLAKVRARFFYLTPSLLFFHHLTVMKELCLKSTGQRLEGSRCPLHTHTHARTHSHAFTHFLNHARACMLAGATNRLESNASLEASVVYATHQEATNPIAQMKRLDSS